LADEGPQTEASLDSELDEQATDNLVAALRVASGEDAPSRSSDRPPDWHSKLVCLGEALRNKAIESKWARVREWSLNIEFYQDRQWSTWNERYRRIVASPRRRQEYLPRIQVNLFKPILIAAAARFLATHPIINVRAGSNDQKAINSARVAQRVVGESEWKRQGMEERLAEVVPTMLLTGMGIWKMEWDSTAGKYLDKAPVFALDAEGMPIPLKEGEDDPTGLGFETEKDEFGQPLVEDAYEGEVKTSVVDPQDFIIDPTAIRLEDAMYCGHVTQRSPAWVYNRYGVRVGTTASSAASHHGWGPGSKYGRQSGTSDNDTTEVIEIWVRAARFPIQREGEDDEIRFPSGWMFAIADGQVLTEGPQRFSTSIFRNKPGPFICMPALRSPRDFWGDTIFNSLRWLQVSLNKALSQIAHNIELMGNSQWLYSVNNDIPESDRTNKPGAWVRWSPTMNPHEVPRKVEGTAATPAAMRYVEALLAFFEKISGQHEGGMAGGTPPNVEAGVALEAIAERDTSRLALTALEIGRGIREWGLMTLAMIQQEWDQARTVSITGKYLESEVFDFAGADVHDTFELSVAPESTLPASKAVKFNRALTLWQAQLIQDPKDVLARIGEEVAEELTLDQLQVSNARDENAMAMAQEIDTPDQQIEMEDPQIHVPQHLRKLFDPEVQGNPEAWTRIYEHIQKHLGIAGNQMQEVMAMQAQAAQPAGQPVTTGAVPGPDNQGGMAPPAI
jgi:hypothetical protein